MAANTGSNSKNHERSAASPSRTERLREIWKKTAKVRLAVGAVLLVWGLVAASSWAVGATCAVAAARAWIAWTWAFLASDGLLRTCGIQKNVTAVSLAVGVSVAALLAIPAAEAAESLVSKMPNPAKTFSFAGQIPVLPKPLPPAEFQLTAETVREIFSDIRSDHPGQGFVTLEQSVRRIEGLARGIPLSDSARLPEAVPGAHSLTVDPSGKIVSAMRKFGLLSGDSAHEFDSVASRLSETNMEKILLDAYSGPETAEGISADPSVLSNIPERSAAPEAPISTEVPPNPVPPVTEIVPHGETPNPSFSARVWALLAIPIGIAWYFWFMRYRRRKEEGAISSKASPVLPERQAVEVASLGVSERSVTPNQTVPAASTGKFANTVPTYPATSIALSEVLTGEYGFSCESGIVENGNVPRSPKTEFVLPTPGGSFRAEVLETEECPVLVFSWRDSSEVRFSASKKLPANGEPHEIRSGIRKALEDAYFDAAEFREKTKNEELRGVRCFEISKRDFEEIHSQLERPETVNGNRETGGFWFWTGYAIRNGVFRFENLANPSQDEIDATSAEFAVRSEAWEAYAGSNVTKAFTKAFSPWERKLLSRATERASKNSGNPNPFPLAVDFFNWHKHPGAPLCPSGGDINHPDSAPGKFEDSPSLGTVTFVIANRLDGSVWTRAEGLWNSRVLKGTDFGGWNDYLLTAWKLLRISPEERAKREEFVRSVWMSKASSLGICDRFWRLLHLGREVEWESWKFLSDLWPVGIRQTNEDEAIFDKTPNRE